MSLQSGLLSHRYSIRIQVPSPHLCSSTMQGLMLEVTGGDAGGKGRGGVKVKDMQANTTGQPINYDSDLVKDRNVRVESSFLQLNVGTVQVRTAFQSR